MQGLAIHGQLDGGEVLQQLWRVQRRLAPVPIAQYTFLLLFAGHTRLSELHALQFRLYALDGRSV